MIITFSNLGSIKKTELDLRPLTVIIGPNNTNKTYIAYSIYGLWKTIRETADIPYIYGTSNGSSEMRMQTDAMLANVRGGIENNTYLFTEQLKGFFQDTSGKIFLKTSFNIEIEENRMREALDELVAENFDIPKGLIARFDKEGREIEFIYENSENKSHVKYLSIGLYSIISKKLFGRPFLLPAERNAFILTYKILANRRYKLLKESRRELLAQRKIEKQLEMLKEQGDIRYPEPIEDFLDFLTDVELQPNIDINEKKKNEFQKLADSIEQNLQGGHRAGLTPTRFGGREIKVNVKKGLDIDLYNASSSIKQIVPLLMYLRYRAQKDDLLIIDEPELNLHPETQAKMLEILGILVNMGVRVLLTTHSPYFMAHLNNLVSGNTEEPALLKKQARSLYLNDPRAFLNMEQVSAYEMKRNKLVTLKDPDFGIRWDTLGDVSAELQKRFFEISEQGNAPAHGKKG